MKDLYPFAGHYLEIDKGIKMHYIDEGKGDPIVMIHGNPTWSFYYRNLIDSLKSSYRTIAPDHIGCGLSDKPDDNLYKYTLENRVHDLENLLQHLNINKNITLILHDWGGMIGMAFAVRHPEAISRLVIMNTSAFHLPEEKSLPWQIFLARNSITGALLVRGFNAFSLGAVNHCVTRNPMPPHIKAGYLKPYDSWKNRIAVHRFVQDIPLKPGDPGYDLVSEVEEKAGLFDKTPLMICWGEKDFVFDRHFLKKWTDRFPDAEVHLFPDAGHYVLEDMKDEIIELVKDFLKRNPL